MSAQEDADTPPEAPDCDEDAAWVASLVSAQRVVVVRPWMVAELGIAAIWFAQLLWLLDQRQTDVIARGDHEWEAETGMTRTQVLRARQKVADKGWITVDVRKTKGTPKAHVRLAVTRLAADLRAVHCAKSYSPGSRDFAQSSSTPAGVSPDPYGSDTDCARADHSEPVTSQPTTEPGALFDEPLPPINRPVSLSEMAAFDAFWKQYPRKENRKTALAAWRALGRRGVNIADVMRGVARFAADPNLPATRFIPHGSTWLNGDAWENPPLPPLPGRNGNGHTSAAEAMAAVPDAYKRRFTQ